MKRSNKASKRKAASAYNRAKKMMRLNLAKELRKRNY